MRVWPSPLTFVEPAASDSRVKALFCGSIPLDLRGSVPRAPRGLGTPCADSFAAVARRHLLRLGGLLCVPCATIAPSFCITILAQLYLPPVIRKSSVLNAQKTT